MPQRVDINLNFLTIAVRGEIASEGLSTVERIIFISNVVLFSKRGYSKEYLIKLLALAISIIKMNFII